MCDDEEDEDVLSCNNRKSTSKWHKQFKNLLSYLSYIRILEVEFMEYLIEMLALFLCVSSGLCPPQFVGFVLIPAFFMVVRWLLAAAKTAIFLVYVPKDIKTSPLTIE